VCGSQGSRSHLAVVSKDEEATKRCLAEGLPLEGDARVRAPGPLTIWSA
jgi:hypothetical protein